MAGTGSSSTLTSCTTGQANTSGANLILLSVSYYGSGSAEGVITDSQSNTWTPIVTSLTENTWNILYSCQSPQTSGTQSFSCTTSATSYPHLSMVAVAGCPSYSVLATNNSASNTSPCQAGAVVAPKGAIVVSGISVGSSTTAVIVNDSMTAVTDASNVVTNVAGGLAYIIQSSAGSISPTWSCSTADTYGMIATIVAIQGSTQADYFPLLDSGGSLNAGNLWSGGLTLASSGATAYADPAFQVQFSKVPVLNSNAAAAAPLSDTAQIQAIFTQTALYGWSILWDTDNASTSTLVLPGNLTVAASGSGPHITYFGSQSTTTSASWPTGVDDYGIRNLNVRKGWPVFGQTYLGDGTTAVNLPVGLASSINTSQGTLQLGSGQSQLLDTIALCQASNPNAPGLYLTLTQGTLSETVLATVINTGNDVLTVMRGQMGTAAASFNATTWNASGGSLALTNNGPTIAETILDSAINISGPLVINHQGNARDIDTFAGASYSYTFPAMSYLAGAYLEGLSGSNISLNIQNAADYGMLLANCSNVNLYNYAKSGTGRRNNGNGDDALHMCGPLAGVVVNGAALASSDNRIVFSNEEAHNQLALGGIGGTGSAGNIDVAVYALSLTPIYYSGYAIHDAFAIFPAENSTINITLDGLTLNGEWMQAITSELVNQTTGGHYSLQMANITGSLSTSNTSYTSFVYFPVGTCDRIVLANCNVTAPSTGGNVMVFLGSNVLPVGYQPSYSGCNVALLNSNSIFSNQPIAYSPATQIQGAWVWPGNFTDPGVGKVLSGTTYTYDGLAKSGSFSAPAQNEVAYEYPYGVSGGSVGSLQPSQSGLVNGYSFLGITGDEVIPPAGDVLDGVLVGTGSGSYTPPSALIVSPSAVLAGVSFTSGTQILSGSMSLTNLDLLAILGSGSGASSSGTLTAGILALSSSNVLNPAVYSTNLTGGTASGNLVLSGTDQLQRLTGGPSGWFVAGSLITGSTPPSGSVLNTAGSYTVADTPYVPSLTILNLSGSDVRNGKTYTTSTGGTASGSYTATGGTGTLVVVWPLAPANANRGKIPFTVQPPGQTVDLSAIVSYNGQLATIERTSAASYTIYQQTAGQWVPVTGHQNVALTPSAVLFDALQSDGEAANYNFRFRPNQSLGQPFPQPGQYLVTVTFSVGGQLYYANFQGQVRW
jgi:hypothetical protein